MKAHEVYFIKKTDWFHLRFVSRSLKPQYTVGQDQFEEVNKNSADLNPKTLFEME